MFQRAFDRQSHDVLGSTPNSSGMFFGQRIGQVEMHFSQHAERFVKADRAAGADAQLFGAELQALVLDSAAD